MKNKIISIIASVMLVLLPQLVYSDEVDIKDETKKDKKPAESTGSAAGSGAAGSAAGGVSLGTVAAIAAIAAAAVLCSGVIAMVRCMVPLRKNRSWRLCYFWCSLRNKLFWEML